MYNKHSLHSDPGDGNDAGKVPITAFSVLSDKPNLVVRKKWSLFKNIFVRNSAPLLCPDSSYFRNLMTFRLNVTMLQISL